MGNKPTIEQRIDKLKPKKGRKQCHWDFIKNRWLKSCPEWEEFLLWVYYDKVVYEWDLRFWIGRENINFYCSAEEFRGAIRRVIKDVEEYGSYPDLRVRYTMEEGTCCWGTCICDYELLQGGWLQAMGGTKEERRAKLAAMIEAARD